MDRGVWKTVATSILVVVGLFTLYLGAFYACFDPEWHTQGYRRDREGKGGKAFVVAEVRYREWGGQWANVVFGTACEVDKKLRPRYYRQLIPIPDFRELEEWFGIGDLDRHLLKTDPDE